MKWFLIAAVPWLVVPDGYETFAIERDYGGQQEWEVRPGEAFLPVMRERICNNVPSEQDARRIADFLNGKAR